MNYATISEACKLKASEARRRYIAHLHEQVEEADKRLHDELYQAHQVEIEAIGTELRQHKSALQQKNVELSETRESLEQESSFLRKKVTVLEDEIKHTLETQAVQQNASAKQIQDIVHERERWKQKCLSVEARLTEELGKLRAVAEERERLLEEKSTSLRELGSREESLRQTNDKKLRCASREFEELENQNIKLREENLRLKTSNDASIKFAKRVNKENQTIRFQYNRLMQQLVGMRKDACPRCDAQGAKITSKPKGGGWLEPREVIPDSLSLASPRATLEAPASPSSDTTPSTTYQRSPRVAGSPTSGETSTQKRRRLEAEPSTQRHEEHRQGSRGTRALSGVNRRPLNDGIQASAWQQAGRPSANHTAIAGHPLPIRSGALDQAAAGGVPDQAAVDGVPNQAADDRVPNQAAVDRVPNQAAVDRVPNQAADGGVPDQAADGSPSQSTDKAQPATGCVASSAGGKQREEASAHSRLGYAETTPSAAILPRMPQMPPPLHAGREAGTAEQEGAGAAARAPPLGEVAALLKGGSIVARQWHRRRGEAAVTASVAEVTVPVPEATHVEQHGGVSDNDETELPLSQQFQRPLPQPSSPEEPSKRLPGTLDDSALRLQTIQQPAHHSGASP
ncbi:hypothetical protein CYMTET_52550 [Cymbomonas tetramitiformis]|uniref:Uncharacterized protein n=1 Tax=Cymbomonas tetramitiformis TaxID=36881 RepID=A0AAE0BKM8_9CHLO|nr:hypothetical protein CYMTET_52550 [Cymbomonas tetramitiformis]